MCHGRIAPKSTAALAVASVGHGVFLPLVILSTLLGESLASGGFGPAFLWGREKAHTFLSPEAGIGDSPPRGQLQGVFCAVVKQRASQGEWQ